MKSIINFATDLAASYITIIFGVAAFVVCNDPKILTRSGEMGIDVGLALSGLLAFQILFAFFLSSIAFRFLFSSSPGRAANLFAALASGFLCAAETQYSVVFAILGKVGIFADIPPLASASAILAIVSFVLLLFYIAANISSLIPKSGAGHRI